MEEKDTDTRFSQELPSQGIGHFFITCFKTHQPWAVPLFVAGVLCSTSAPTPQGPTSGPVWAKEWSSAHPWPSWSPRSTLTKRTRCVWCQFQIHSPQSPACSQGACCLGCGSGGCWALLHQAKALGDPEPAGCQVCRQTAPRAEPAGRKHQGCCTKHTREGHKISNTISCRQLSQLISWFCVVAILKYFNYILKVFIKMLFVSRQTLYVGLFWSRLHLKRF